MPKFTPAFLDELKARLKPSDVIGAKVKLQRKGNEWAGLSPFTKEKTPSFFVNDQKGFYHCFSSGKHGDIIGFLRETEQLTFSEAVEQLAAKAGLPLPTDTESDRLQERRRKGLEKVCEAASDFFAATLRRAQGRPGADYLARRGVGRDEIAFFRLGYAPSGRTGLKDWLIGKGFDDETLVEAGLVIKPDDGGATYDRFRDRVMFPILGARGGVIAFGGRALDPAARAKYLNSPETPLFHKGDVLYNYAAARESAGSAPLVVCEGYMDVIALWGAGVRRAVAPLGTALTEAQLSLLWRVCGEPVLCFDGDRAGQAAAFRAIDRALPLLRPDRSLSFAFLPGGKDPDDLIRSEGAAGFEAVLRRADGLAETLWRRETEGRDLSTPEKRAGLRVHLRELVRSIADTDVRAAYGAEYARRLSALLAPPPVEGASPTRYRDRVPYRRGQPKFEVEPRPTADQKRSSSLKGAREATLVLTLIAHPELFERCQEAVFSLALAEPDAELLLSEALRCILETPSLDSAGLKSHLHQSPAAVVMARYERGEALNAQRLLKPETPIDEVERAWREDLRHHLAVTAAAWEVAHVATRIATDPSDGAHEDWRAAVWAREELTKRNGDPDEQTDDSDISAGDLHEQLKAFRQSFEGKARNR